MRKRFRHEFTEAELGDMRRSDRLAELGIALAAFPGASLPAALGDGAALEAAYRFLGNEAIEANQILEPHVRETVERCAEHDVVVVAHDTTDFKFPGKARRDLGRMRGLEERGFFAHTSLAVTLDDWRVPIGVLHLETWTRGPKRAKRRRTKAERQSDPDLESLRWLRGIDAVEEELPEHRAIHVMDREADAYDLLTMLVQARRRFIVRATFDRRVGNADRLANAVAVPPLVVTREVPLSERKPAEFEKARKIHPPRSARTATLGIKAIAVELLRPADLATELPAKLPINVVVVEEVSTPAGESPVSWWLYTTEPIGTPSDLERIVDAYRCRWRVEEFFKALKTGCAIEKRQLETRHSLVNALAIYVPIAWRMLRHRSLAHAAGDRPASAVLTPLQIKILRRVSRTKLPDEINTNDAFLAIAALGGHLKRNGPPGWLTIGRGYERLLTLEEGVLLGEEM
jgi:hypothetical protein